MEDPFTEPELEQTSAEKIAVSEDIAGEIFIHLPATSLARLKWVSKHWFSFISNPVFISRHTQLYPPSLCGLFLIPKQTSYNPKFQYLSLNQSRSNVLSISFLNSQGFRILHACNGLLLCHSGFSYYVCNPTMRQIRVLPSCAFMESHQFALNLAFDPPVSPCYKVVCVQKLDMEQGSYQIAIYSSETHLWSLCNEPVLAPYGVDFKDGVFCYGSIHWLNRASSGVYLDLKTQMLREMPQPPRREEQSQYNFKYFGKSQGCLFYVVSRPLLNHYELYQMNEDYSGWDLKFRVNLNVLVGRFPAMARNFGHHPLFSEFECDVMCIDHGGNAEDMAIVLSTPGNVIVLNLKNKTSIAIRDPVLRPYDVTIWYKIYSAYECFETLSLV